MKIINYSKEYKEQWDAFVKKAKNSHFFFQRDYMEYHSDRFVDFSLLVLNEKNLSIFYPRNTFNKMGHFIKPKRKIIKKFNNSWFEKSLQNSINYFIKISHHDKKFKIKDFNRFLKVNKIIIKN